MISGVSLSGSMLTKNTLKFSLFFLSRLLGASVRLYVVALILQSLLFDHFKVYYIKSCDDSHKK